MPYLVTELRKLDKLVEDQGGSSRNNLNSYSYEYNPKPRSPSPYKNMFDSPKQKDINKSPDNVFRNIFGSPKKEEVNKDYYSNYEYNSAQNEIKKSEDAAMSQNKLSPENEPKQTKRILISGMRVRAKWRDLMFCLGFIAEVNEEGKTCDIRYDDGDFEAGVRFDLIEPLDQQPNPAVRAVLESHSNKSKSEINGDNNNKNNQFGGSSGSKDSPGGKVIAKRNKRASECQSCIDDNIDKKDIEKDNDNISVASSEGDPEENLWYISLFNIPDIPKMFPFHKHTHRHSSEMTSEAIELFNPTREPPYSWTARLTEVFSRKHVYPEMQSCPLPRAPLLLYVEDELTLGRLAQPMGYWDGVVPDLQARTTISRAHFVIKRNIFYFGDGTPFSLTNNSANGIKVNDKRLDKGETVDLFHNDEIGFIANRETETRFIIFIFQMREQAEILDKKREERNERHKEKRKSIIDKSVEEGVVAQIKEIEKKDAKSLSPDVKQELDVTKKSNPEDVSSPKNKDKKETNVVKQPSPERKEGQAEQVEEKNPPKENNEKSNMNDSMEKSNNPANAPIPFRSSNPLRTENNPLMQHLPEDCVAGRWDSADSGANAKRLQKNAKFAIEISGDALNDNTITPNARRIFFVPGSVRKKLRIGRWYQKRLWQRILKNAEDAVFELPDDIIEIDILENNEYTARIFCPMDQDGIDVDHGDEVELDCDLKLADFGLTFKLITDFSDDSQNLSSQTENSKETSTSQQSSQPNTNLEKVDEKIVPRKELEEKSPHRYDKTLSIETAHNKSSNEDNKNTELRSPMTVLGNINSSSNSSSQPTSNKNSNSNSATSMGTGIIGTQVTIAGTQSGLHDGIDIFDNLISRCFP